MYGFTTELELPFDQAVERVTAALKEQGFGVLSDIDVQHAMHEKLGEEMRPYRILGACNPPLAFKALQADVQIGLLLPCNVVVRQTGEDRVSVDFVDPLVMMQMVDQPQVREVAEDAERRLRKACDSLKSG